jgi:hypothetical protein
MGNLALGMVMKKNGCPMAFLWSGQGYVLFFTRLGSAGFCLLMMVKLAALAFGIILNIKPYLVLTLALFFIGKILPIIKRIIFKSIY